MLEYFLCKDINLIENKLKIINDNQDQNLLLSVDLSKLTEKIDLNFIEKKTDCDNFAIKNVRLKFSKFRNF